MAVSQFSKGDASGTQTGGAVNAMTFSGNGGSAFSEQCQAATTEAEAQACAQAEIGALATQVGHDKLAVNFTWTLILGAFVLFMQAGFALLTTGLTRAKNAGHMMMLNFAAFVIAWIAYYAVGFAFQFGGVGSTTSAPGNLGGAMVLGKLLTVGSSHWGLIGLHGFFLQSGHSYDVSALGALLLRSRVHGDGGLHHRRRHRRADQLQDVYLRRAADGRHRLSASTATGSGAAAGSRRSGTRFNLGHGVVDFAGSGVVHGVGGLSALALAMLLGPRIGKFRKDGKPNAIPGHNIAFVVTGTFILLFGWMGFNPGSTLGGSDLRIAVIIENTATASVFGAAAAMAWTAWLYGKPDISMSCNGMLAGLVAITAPCAFVAPWAAALIGFVAGLLVVRERLVLGQRRPRRRPLRRHLRARRLRHVGRRWPSACSPTARTAPAGTASPATSPASSTAMPDSSARSSSAPSPVSAWAFGLTTLVFGAYKLVTSMRVSAEAEVIGLDVPEFGVPGYAGFVMERELHGSIPEELVRRALPYLPPAPGPIPESGGGR